MIFRDERRTLEAKDDPRKGMIGSSDAAATKSYCALRRSKGERQLSCEFWGKQDQETTCVTPCYFLGAAGGGSSGKRLSPEKCPATGVGKAWPLISVTNLCRNARPKSS